MTSATPGPVVVIGAGPAGVAAVTWLRRLEVPLRWFDAANDAGGTLLRVGNPIDDLPGVSGPDGPRVAARLLAHTEQMGLHPELGVSVSVDAFDRLEVRCRRGDSAWSLAPSAVVVCTGTRPRLLGLEREAEWLERGIEISVTRNLSRYAGRPVAVVGGGDAALEGALLLADCCPVVHLIHRRDSWRAQRRFVERVLAHAAIRRHQPREVIALEGDERLAGVTLDDGTRLAVAGLFERVGVEASTPAGLEAAERDEAGYLTVDRSGETSVAGVFAAGDVLGDVHQSVAWSLGTGARAAASAATRYDTLRGQRGAAR